MPRMPPPSARTDYLIVGAGPTGLGAAWRLAELGQHDWCLCEAGTAFGGLAGSTLDADGFTWDYGGHVRHSHYDYFDDLMDGLLGPDGWISHARESWIWVSGRFVPYPFQLNLHRLPDEAREDCVEGRLNVYCRNSIPGEIGYLVSLLRDKNVAVARKFYAGIEAVALSLDPRIRNDLLYPGDRWLFAVALMRFLRGSAPSIG